MNIIKKEKMPKNYFKIIFVLIYKYSTLITNIVHTALLY